MHLSMLTVPPPHYLQANSCGPTHHTRKGQMHLYRAAGATATGAAGVAILIPTTLPPPAKATVYVPTTTTTTTTGAPLSLPSRACRQLAAAAAVLPSCVD